MKFLSFTGARQGAAQLPPPDRRALHALDDHCEEGPDEEKEERDGAENGSPQDGPNQGVQKPGTRTTLHGILHFGSGDPARLLVFYPLPYLNIL